MNVIEMLRNILDQLSNIETVYWNRIEMSRNEKKAMLFYQACNNPNDEAFQSSIERILANDSSTRDLRFMKLNESFVFFCFDAAQCLIVGAAVCIRLLYVGGECNYLVALGVNPRYRRMSIGRCLCEMAACHPSLPLFVECMDHGHTFHFYESSGFIRSPHPIGMMFSPTHHKLYTFIHHPISPISPSTPDSPLHQHIARAFFCSEKFHPVDCLPAPRDVSMAFVQQKHLLAIGKIIKNERLTLSQKEKLTDVLLMKPLEAIEIMQSSDPGSKLQELLQINVE